MPSIEAPYIIEFRDVAVHNSAASDTAASGPQAAFRSRTSTCLSRAEPARAIGGGMWIRTRPASANISLEARAPASDRPVPTQEIVSFELLPTNERDHLDLDTGEVFQYYSYARLHKKEDKLIGASITIRAIPDDSFYQHNAMRYMGDFGPSAILFDVFIAPTAFRELTDNIRGGLLPQTITVGLARDASLFFTNSANSEKKAPLEYGWEPDGSGLIWHNKEKERQKVPVESIRFDYEVVKPRYDDEQINRLLPMQSDAPTDRISEQIASIQTILADVLKYLRWATIGIVALAIMIGILISKQRMPF